MIKRSIVISNPARLSSGTQQLVIKNDDGEHKVPLEDIGFLIVESRQCTMTSALLDDCGKFNIALVSCDESHMPSGLHLPMSSHSTYTQRVRKQLEATDSLKDNIWKQLVSAKVARQGDVLAYMGNMAGYRKAMRYSKEVTSGDSTNIEATCAQMYWPQFSPYFFRAQNGPHPNSWLNYGYAIVRAATARAIVGAGLLPVSGVFHKNKYNPYCLADDLMEPYRPFVDRVVYDLKDKIDPEEERLPKEVRIELLKLLTATVQIKGQQSPLMNAVQHTAYSLAQIYIGEKRKLELPEFIE